MRTRLAVIALALALAGTLLAAAPASAVWGPFDYPRGADTSVPYLAGRTLHVGTRTYTVPDQSESGDYRVDYSLIGLDARGRWLIGVDMDLVFQPEEYYYRYGARERILALGPGGFTTVFDKVSNYGAGAHFRLNRNRSSVVLRWDQTDDDSFASVDVLVIGLDGRVRARARNLHPSLVAFDASGNRVVLGGRYGARARVWRPGVATRWLTRKASTFADLRTGALVVQGPSSRWALTSLSRPGRVRWQAWFQPMRISPDGKRVAGTGVRRANGRPVPTVQIRRRSDGRLIRSFRYTGGRAIGQTLVWVGNTSVVFEASETGQDLVLVHCGTGGSCVRVSDPVADAEGGLSVAFEPDPRGF